MKLEEPLSLIEQLFTTYYDQLRLLCMSHFNYRSEYLPYVDDCIQNAFLAAYRKRGLLAKHPNPYAWLANACIKQCLSYIRRNDIHCRIMGKPVPLDEQQCTACIQDDIIRWINQNDAKQRLHRIYSHLTDKEQIVYTEYFQRNRKAAQIADDYGLSVTAVYASIQRIRKKALKYEGIIIFFVIWTKFLFVCS